MANTSIKSSSQCARIILTTILLVIAFVPTGYAFIITSSASQISRRRPVTKTSRRDFVVTVATSLIVNYKIPSEPSRSTDKIARGMTNSQEIIGGAIGGLVVSTSKILIKHPLDTITVRIQLARKERKELTSSDLFEGLWSGVLPPVLFGAPSGAIFFSVKDFAKARLQVKHLMNVDLGWAYTSYPKRLYLFHFYLFFYSPNLGTRCF